MDHSEVKHLPKVDHAPAELDEISRLLLATADYIERHGLRQNSGGVHGGPRCLGGTAISAGQTVTSVDWQAAMDRVTASVGRSYTSWNDAPGRTAAEVIAKLRAVALGL